MLLVSPPCRRGGDQDARGGHRLPQPPACCAGPKRQHVLPVRWQQADLTDRGEHVRAQPVRRIDGAELAQLGRGAQAASPVSVVPTGSGTAPSGGGHGTARASTTPASSEPILARSLPTHLSIPAIGVDSDLKQIGLTVGGQIRTPPLVRDSHAYRLDVSPTPGQLGPATIIGHVDSAAYGPGVFFRLGDLRQRDTISVTR
ncbi:MAG: hypothetical protein ACRDWT_06805 [Jatrophihabitantaceae bacterium]